jgi:hypothetical protein
MPDIACVTCGRMFAHGFAALNHARACTRGEAYVDDGPDDVVFPDDEANDDGDVADAVVPRDSIDAHFTKLEAAGTLDCKHVLQYLGWGKVTLTEKNREVCRFLRSVEQGGGASVSSMRANLDYARTLGGRGNLLPRTVRCCWARVEKVCRNVH